MKAKHFTKMVAWLLCVLMIAACLPVAALADTDFEGPIDVFETQLSNGENEIQIYSASTPGAAQYSGYAGTYTFAISTSVEGADGVMTVNGETIYSSETHEVVYAGEKSGAVINVTDIHIEDGEGQYVAGNVTITVTQIVEGNGTEDYPYELGDGNDMSLTIIVPAGKTVYYNSIYGGYTLTVSGANGFALEQGGVTYEDEYGKASLIVPEGAMQGTPAIIAITNNSDANQTYYVSYTEVTAENEELTLGVEASHTFAEDDAFYNFIYTAEKDGELQVYISSTTGWQLVVNEEDLYYSDMNGEEVPFSYNVTAGDELLISVNTQNDDKPYGAFPAGTITVKVEYKEEVVLPSGDAELKIDGKSLSLKNDLTVNFFVNKDVIENYSNVYVDFIMDGSSETIRMEGKQYSTDLYVFAYEGVSPYMAGDVINATLHGTYEGVEYTAPTVEYSVAMYCYKQIRKESADAGLKKVCVNLLNFAAEHQIYNDYKLDQLCNADLTEQEKAYGSTGTPTLANHKNKEYVVLDGATAQFTGVTLSLKESVEIVFYFTTDNWDGVSLQITDGSRVWEIPADEFVNGEYSNEKAVYFTDLVTAEMTLPVQATLYRNGTAISNTYQYSIVSYAYNVITNHEKYSQSIYKNLIDLVTAMMFYGESANAFFA